MKATGLMKIKAANPSSFLSTPSYFKLIESPAILSGLEFPLILLFSQQLLPLHFNCSLASFSQLSRFLSPSSGRSHCNLILPFLLVPFAVSINTISPLLSVTPLTLFAAGA